MRFAQIDDVRLKYFFFSMFPTMMWQGWHMFRALKHKKGSDVRLKDYVVLNSLELWGRFHQHVYAKLLHVQIIKA